MRTTAAAAAQRLLGACTTSRPAAITATARARLPLTAAKSAATTTRTFASNAAPNPEWKERVARGPGFADFVRGSDVTATAGVDVRAADDDTNGDDMEQLTPEESLQQIHAMLKQIRETERTQEHAAARSPTLVDRFGREHTYLRISLTERCNLRCRYCMPADGVPLQPVDKLLSTPEIVRLARLFAASGVTRIRLTGGEPLLRRDLVDLVAQLRAIDGIRSVGVTTNGIVLQRKLAALQSAGVDRLNISLDTLRADRFTDITRRAGLQRVLAAIDDAQALGFAPVKLNCVVMRHVNLDELVDFVAFTARHAVDVRFIEWMPFDSNKWSDETFVSFREMLATIRAAFPSVAKLRDDAHDTSKAFHVPGFRGQFGFITSMSEHFCGSCNRLRLTADGSLKVCLFGNAEVSLRDAMRYGVADRDIQDIIDVAVKRKKFALGGHGDMYGISKAKNRPMILIGG